MPAHAWWRAYGAALLCGGLLDAIWLGGLSGNLYSEGLKGLMGPVQALPALLFYVFYPALLVSLCLRPRPNHWQQAAARGAMAGLMAFGTYDMTNWASIANWPWHVSVIDLAWGTLFSTLSSCAAYAALPRLTDGAPASVGQK
jgi:uncharacterized membrane protein